MASSDFRPDIEGLRAVAILLVLLYHAQIDAFSGGFIGVDVFFVLSGFLITRSLIREAEGTGRIRLGAFYARRVRRLLPASALTLVATAAAIWAFLPTTMWRAFGGDVAGAAAYIVNWRFAGRAVDYLAQDVLPSPVQHFWSLSIEEQFYFVWPMLIIVGVWIAARIGWSRRVAAGVLLTAVILVPSLGWSVYLTSADPAAAFFVTTTRLWEMAVGSVVAVAGARLTIERYGPRVAAKGGALLAILVAAVRFDDATPWPGFAALVPVVATAVLIVAGGTGPDLIERVLSVKPMQLVGAWSYSLYLWHWPPLAIAAAVVGGLTTLQAIGITVLSLVPALLAYRFVETPLRYRSSLRESVPLTLSLGLSLSLVGVVAGLAVVVATPLGPQGAAAQPDGPADAAGESVDAPDGPLGAAWVTGDVTADEVYASLADVEAFFPTPETALADRPSTYAEGCQVTRHESEPVVCERGDPGGSLTVALVGDSKIAQWEPAFDVIGRSEGWRVLNITKSACELSLEQANWQEEPYPECLEWSQAVLDSIDELGIDVVVVSQVSRDGWLSDDVPRDRGVLRSGMTGAYEAVRAAGAQVVVLLDNPGPPLEMGAVPDCVAQNMEDLSVCAFDANPAAGSRTVQQAVAESGGYPVVDMIDLVCPAGVCAPVIGDVLVYRNGSHITATYVLSMADALGERLVEALSGGPAQAIVQAHLIAELKATIEVQPSPATVGEDVPSIYPDGCQVDQRSPEPIVCERGQASGETKVALVGDSKVAQWEPALDDIGRRLGWSVANITKSSCELTLAMPNLRGEPYPSCLEWSRNVLELLADDPPDVVIVSQGSGTGWGGDDRPEDVDVITGGMAEAYETIRAMGSEVVVMLDNPRPPLMVPECVAENLDRLDACVFTWDPDAESESRTAQQAVIGGGGYPYIDMADVICPTELCLPVIDGTLVYRDRTHLSVSFVLDLESELEDRLRPLVGP